MIIGIEVQRLFRRKKHGMEIVALETIRQIQQIDKTNKYIVFTKKDEDSYCLTENVNFKIQQTVSKPFPVWEQLLLPRLAAKNKVDLLHCTSNTAPLFCKVPLVITIHDIIYLERLDFSGSAYQNFGNLYRRFIVPRVAKKAKLIITVSEYAKQLIAKRLGIPESKIMVVYNGVSHVYKKINEDEGVADFRNKYKLPEKFFLHFSNTAPRKNTIGALKAYALHCKKAKCPLALVITNCNRANLTRPLLQINATEYLTNIINLDYITAAELPYLYNAATIFLYPSFNEGFGMPVIESMACGTPVITSGTSSLPEVSGGAAILADPFNHEEIANAMNELVGNKDLYKEKLELGLKNAQRFSWKNAADKVLSVYDEIKRIT